MPQYYNFTEYSNVSGIMGFMKVTSEQTGHLFGLMLVLVTFLIPLITLIRRGETPINALSVSSLYSSLLAIFLFLAQVITSGMIILIPALIYVSTIVIKWYNQ